MKPNTELHGAGELRTVLGARPHRDTAIRATFFSGAVIDITEEKAAEEKLLEQTRALEGSMRPWSNGWQIEGRASASSRGRVAPDPEDRGDRPIDRWRRARFQQSPDDNHGRPRTRSGVRKPEDTARIKRAADMA